MILSGITEYCKYNYKNHLWQLARDNDLMDAITEYTLISETLSGTIIPGVRLRLGLKPH
jgi:hypothetical protein